MSDESIESQSEEIFKLPRPQDTYKNLPEEIQDVIAETLVALQREIGEHNASLKVMDPGTKEYLAISHLRSSAFTLFMQISGANSAEEQQSAVTKAIVHIEKKSETDRRQHEAAMKRLRAETMAGLVDTTSPAELQEHIAQQDAVDKENGVERGEESPFKVLARKRAAKSKKK